MTRASSGTPRPSPSVVRGARSDNVVKRLYERSLPESARGLIRRRVPVGARLWVRRRLADLGAAVMGVFQLARRAVTGWARSNNPDERIVTFDGRSVVAVTTAALAPLSVQRSTLKLVCDALDAVGAEYFRVRGTARLASQIGVPEPQRRLVAAAIAGLARSHAIYVADPEQPQRLRRLRGSRPLSRDQNLLRLVRFHADASGGVVFGPEHHCDIELWQPEPGDQLRAPRPNRCVEFVGRSGETVEAGESTFTSLTGHGDESQPRYRTRPEFLGLLPDDHTFPIDAVFTWVDQADPEWQARRDAAIDATDTTGLHGHSANNARFVNRDELRYALRSLNTYAPWINHIWIVTDQQRPQWLDVRHPKLTVVDHKDIFEDPNVLPTFNSHAIESQLHRIPGLSEHFLYFNDDMMLGRPIGPDQFFTAAGVAKVFPSPRKLGVSPVSPEDVPATAAGKNTRTLIERRFGRTTSAQFLHCPYALNREVLADMWSEFEPELRATAARRLRHPRDVSPTSSLYQYYAYFRHRALLSPITTKYVDISTTRAFERLQDILATRAYATICVNDTQSPPEKEAEYLRIVTRFLSAYFPQAAPWEV
ncbi:stealth family protein [Stackebrandtia nassauensis]|uniref:UDP-N-acetylglucosamine--lysosomal-enzyme N-acetylglucosamine phosphotransferase n=1 Tax=Stackebrandtia nassauensis (strain DSM 44728 / CIP 108903 / NRRL B-16338 / NBRC 102104 / LLR-40K-21) TaxID=446470 RepID=D3PXX3_STANL|nr:stealth family protein [Stackebrandtia nassauensis]ADD45302.1 UDP-N-acetylglucosamine--lysosomal-enzyme N-acetylglucosamine phosphotransferase [Stackebrandtia nassauensis DSM 44728]